MGGTHKARNIPNELKELHNGLVREGLTHESATRIVFRKAITSIDDQLNYVIAHKKALGASMLNEYIKFYYKNRQTKQAQVRDELARSLVKFSVVLAGYTHSDRSRNRIIDNAEKLVGDIDLGNSPEFVIELKELSYGFPMVGPVFKDMVGNVPQHRLRAIDKFMGTVQKAVDESRAQGFNPGI